jgi:hypothetical protein
MMESSLLQRHNLTPSALAPSFYNTPPCEAPMPFSTRPSHRFPVHCSVTYNAESFQREGTIWNFSNKEIGTFYVFIISRSMLMCGCPRNTPFILSLQHQRGGLALSHRARVQRGEPATARCASTGDF